MGRVYLAEDVVLGRRTAIKFVSERMSGDPDSRARFLREARTMATVEHSHVVRVYSFGEVDGSAYLVMEYVAGESLSERLKRTGRLDATEAIKITRHVAEALEAAWEHHLVHRDIKPSNIMLDTKGMVRVADFGLAKPLGVSTSDANLTQAGEILGTPHYVSPEQARGHPADIRSDIYSLGIVLYEMLSGERPFQGRTPFDVVAKHIHEPLPSIAALRADLPPSVIALVNWMTEKGPERRPQSYAALRERLRTLGDEGTSTPLPTSTLKRAEPHRPILVRAQLAVLVTLLLGAVGAGYRAYQYRAPPIETRLVVAVTPFSGPDDNSANEGKVYARLVEKAIEERLGRLDVRVLSGDQTWGPVRDHAGARALGERLGANAVVWGEAFVLRGETEIQPNLTLVPRRPSVGEMNGGRTELAQDPLEAFAERSSTSLLVSTQAARQIELRKTGAAGVSDLVLVLAGSYALTEGRAQKALDLFSLGPRTPESFRRRADALLMLNKTEEARQALSEAVRLGPDEAQNHASLGDLLLTSDRFSEAVTAYTTASRLGGPYRSREAIISDGKLYRRETYRERFGSAIRWVDTLYMLGLDPASGRVLERHLLPGEVLGLTPNASGFTITYAGAGGEEAETSFAQGVFSRPVFLPGKPYRLLWGGGDGVLRDLCTIDWTRPDSPQNRRDPEAMALRAHAIDPTQPEYLFWLGRQAWVKGRKDEAETRWRELFDGAFPGLPFPKYLKVAEDLEELGAKSWADRAYREAVSRHKTLAADLHFVTGNRFLMSGLNYRAREAFQRGGDPIRAHLWLSRAREFTGLNEEDAVAAATWERFFKERGDRVMAAGESEVWHQIAKDPLYQYMLPTRLDFAIALFLALNAAAWSGLGTLMLIGRQRARRRGANNVRAAVSEISGRERRSAALAFVLAVVSFAPVALQANRTLAARKPPMYLSDSLGGVESVHWAKGLAKDSQAKVPATFVAGVVHHLAGDLAAARDFYNSISDDPRAKANLVALSQGQRIPPVPITATDVVLAMVGQVTPSETLVLSQMTGEIRGSIANSVLTTLLITLTLGIIAACFWSLIPYPRAQRPGPSRIGWSILLPGAPDLWLGSPFRGQLGLSLGALPLLALGLAVYASRIAPASGPVAASLMRLDFVNMPAYSFWGALWAQPGAVAYWSWVGTAALAAILLQVLAVRRARRQHHPDLRDDATLSRQDTLASVTATQDALAADRDGTHDSRM